MDGVIGVRAIFFRSATCDRTSKPCDVSLVSERAVFFDGDQLAIGSRNWAFASRAACQAT